MVATLISINWPAYARTSTGAVSNRSTAILRCTTLYESKKKQRANQKMRDTAAMM
eukprot:CAMPEP_0194507612 /NCGR_PEP_ID=MMETSP0253-20130528/37164_1 /TAXON_ID=2966 /ORGANISM="Noctiluca scintillans" /LENGTH=54 /DNA_ID=CAMNT_0039350527 /DNA_START=471 /DNA_END=635 /DNA_ORIENTATION=-